MSSILNNPERWGNFTSSEAVALFSMGTREMSPGEKEEHKRLFPKSAKKNIECWPGPAAVTYINEKNIERRLGMSIDSDVDAKPLSWGKLGEQLVEVLLGDDLYYFSPNDSHLHPTVENWSGSRDAISKDAETVAEVKCPATRKSFVQLVQPLHEGLEGMAAMDAIRFGYKAQNGLDQPKHPDGEKFFWQICSNACISGCKYGELIIFMPYESELPAVQSAAETLITQGESQYYWIASAKPEQLPHIKDGGYYSHLYIIRFEIPEEDKILLTDRIKQASQYLIKR
jgi:hypothetical protein